jgi:RNA polymerase sigma-70 factor (ECF subfamily)
VQTAQEPEAEPPAGPALPERAVGRLDFDTVYRRWFDDVCRWLAALAGPGLDPEDLSQEVFIVVRRKLHRFEGDDPRAWLYGISVRVARSERRRAWFRRAVLGRSAIDPDELVNAHDLPEEAMRRARRSRALYGLLEELSEKRRRAFVLFEIVGYEADEIARLEGIPAATVRTRVFHARKDLLELARRRPEIE